MKKYYDCQSITGYIWTRWAGGLADRAIDLDRDRVMPKSKVAQARIGWQKSSSNEGGEQGTSGEAEYCCYPRFEALPARGRYALCAVKYNMQGKRGSRGA